MAETWGRRDSTFTSLVSANACAEARVAAIQWRLTVGRDGFSDVRRRPLAFTNWLTYRHSVAAETVLEPFMGSGATGVVCAILRCRFVGIEIEPPAA